MPTTGKWGLWQNGRGNRIIKQARHRGRIRRIIQHHNITDKPLCACQKAAAIKDKGIEFIWMQLGVRNDEAASRAEVAGLNVIMDRCPKIEYGRLYGELSWSGVNSRIISAKRPRIMQRRRNG